METLGRLFDLSAGFTPVNMATGTNSGFRVSLRFSRVMNVVLYGGAGTVGNDAVLTFTQYSALSGGTSANLVAIDHYYTKIGSTALAGTETWTRTAQTVSQTVTLAGTSANAFIAVVPVYVDKLTVDTYSYLGVSVAQTGAAQIAGMLYLAGDLQIQRKAANMPAGLS